MRAVIFRLALLTLVLAAPRAPLSAQASPPLAVGARVRVTAPAALSPPRQTGSVLALAGESLVLRLERRGDSLAIPMAQVTELEVSRGRRTAVRKGIVIGLLVGAAVGTIGGAVLWDEPDCDPAQPLTCNADASDAERWIFATSLGVGGALAGAVVGGLLGARGTERWEGVTFGMSGRLGVAPARGGGLSISYSARF